MSEAVKPYKPSPLFKFRNKGMYSATCAKCRGYETSLVSGTVQVAEDTHGLEVFLEYLCSKEDCAYVSTIRFFDDNGNVVGQRLK